jgi:hypothetical protein
MSCKNIVKIYISKIATNMRIIFCLIQIIFVFLFYSASAQRNRYNPIATVTPWEIGLSAGASSFLTSINPEPNAQGSRINYWQRDFNPGFGLSLVRNISPSLGVEISWLNTRLTGTWNNKFPALAIAQGKDSPLTFNSQINQFDMMMAFNLNQIMVPGNDEDIWHIYGKTGISISQITDTKKFYSGDTYIRMGFALDAGFSVSLSPKIKLMAGSTFRFLNTDNLDGVHVISTDLNGQPVDSMKSYEIYNFTYLKLSLCMGKFRNPF